MSKCTNFQELLFRELRLNIVLYSLKGSVVEDMKLLKESVYLRKDLKVYGYVFDIKTGKLEEVKA